MSATSNFPKFNEDAKKMLNNRSQFLQTTVREGDTVPDILRAEMTADLLLHGLDAPFLQEDYVHTQKFYVRRIPRHEITYEDVRTLSESLIRNYDLTTDARSMLKTLKSNGRHIHPVINRMGSYRRHVALGGIIPFVGIMALAPVLTLGGSIVLGAFAAVLGCFMGWGFTHAYIKRRSKIGWISKIPNFDDIRNVPVFTPADILGQYLSGEISLHKLLSRNRSRANESHSESQTEAQDSEAPLEINDPIKMEEIIRSLKGSSDIPIETIEETIPTVKEVVTNKVKLKRSSR